MDNVKNVYIPHTLRSLPYFRYSSSCDQLLYDFPATKAPIGFLLDGKVRRFLKIPKDVHFAEIIDTIKGLQTGSILFFFVDHLIDKRSEREQAFAFDFPLMFKHENQLQNEEKFLLKALLIHYPDHFVTCVRRSFTDRFLKIDDSKVTEAQIERQFVHLALYLKCF
jgi:hypothetical protein